MSDVQCIQVKWLNLCLLHIKEDSVVEVTPLCVTDVGALVHMTSAL